MQSFGEKYKKEKPTKMKEKMKSVVNENQEN